MLSVGSGVPENRNMQPVGPSVPADGNMQPVGLNVPADNMRLALTDRGLDLSNYVMAQFLK